MQWQTWMYISVRPYKHNQAMHWVRLPSAPSRGPRYCSIMLFPDYFVFLIYLYFCYVYFCFPFKCYSFEMLSTEDWAFRFKRKCRLYTYVRHPLAQLTQAIVTNLKFVMEWKIRKQSACIQLTISKHKKKHWNIYLRFSKLTTQSDLSICISPSLLHTIIMILVHY